MLEGLVISIDRQQHATLTSHLGIMACAFWVGGSYDACPSLLRLIFWILLQLRVENLYITILLSADSFHCQWLVTLQRFSSDPLWWSDWGQHVHIRHVSGVLNRYCRNLYFDAVASGPFSQLGHQCPQPSKTIPWLSGHSLGSQRYTFSWHPLGVQGTYWVAKETHCTPPFTLGTTCHSTWVSGLLALPLSSAASCSHRAAWLLCGTLTLVCMPSWLSVPQQTSLTMFTAFHEP